MSLLGFFGEDIAHDSDQHVQHRYLSENSCQYENDDHNNVHGTMSERVESVELSKRQEVLIVENVEQPEPKLLFDYLHVFFVAVALLIQQVEWQTKKCQSYDEQKQEIADLVDRLRDQSDEEGCLVEKSKPVVQLNHQECTSNSSHYLTTLEINQLVILEYQLEKIIETYDPNEAIRDKVRPVPPLEEVQVLVILALELQVLSVQKFGHYQQV